MIHELAAFEHAAEDCAVTESQITAALFGGDAVASCHLAEVSGRIAAMALWFRNFSTWDGVAGIHLRTFSFGRSSAAGAWPALLATLARECVQRGYSRLSWAVLDWNTQAIALYDAVGGRECRSGFPYRVCGPDLSALALSEPALSE